MIRYTTAPDAYDGFGTKTLGIVASDNGKPVRRVEIEEKHSVWQHNRYASGLHCCYSEDDYQRFVKGGIFDSRCPVCHWPLVTDTKDGCVFNNCSQRP